jgi:hypothetical protein
MIVVISTGFNAPTKEHCLASVQAQRGVPYEHTYVEAAHQDPPLSACENFDRVARALHPQDIVVMLDGDDWLYDAHALASIAEVYAAHDPWVTWGSYVTQDGKEGISAPYPLGANFRDLSWWASHVKTFRAWLYHRVLRSDMQDEEGDWLQYAWDQAVMFPLLEMAGPRAHFVREILYVYNEPSSFDVTHPEKRAEVAEAVRLIRSRPVYPRIVE